MAVALIVASAPPGARLTTGMKDVAQLELKGPITPTTAGART